MKHFVLPSLLALFIFIYGCSAPIFLTLDGMHVKQKKEVKSEIKPVDDYYDYLNPRFIDNTINNLEYPNQLWGSLNKKEKIIVAPLDRITNENNDQQLVVERSIIHKLVKEGYDVYDRTKEVINRGISENPNGLNYTIPSNKSDSLKSFKLPSTFVYGDIIFAYRLLELGMVKINQANTNTVKRIGRTTVEIRLVDAKTLKIIYTEILNGKYTDLISDEISNSIADFHYKFEDDALPFSQKKQATNQITIIKPENKKSIDTPPNSFLKSAGLIFSFQKGGAAGHFHIRSKGGANIYSFDVPKGDGDQDITWDCQDRNGENLPDGTYELYSIKDDSVNVLATFSLVD